MTGATLFKSTIFNQAVTETTLKAFVKELVAFHNDYYSKDPEIYKDVSLQLFNFPLTRHFLVGTHPNTETILLSIVHNLKGYRRLFGEGAGEVFAGKAWFSTVLTKPDGEPGTFYLVIEKGNHEYMSGLQFAIFEGNPYADRGNRPDVEEM